MNKYRDIGFKLTPQRLAILDYLEGNRKHPSAEDIYRAVLKTFPTISFATVYTTLAALKQKGKLLELSTDPAKKHYDPDTTCHSHLFCVSCKRVFDMPGEHTPVLPESVRRDFLITRSHVEFHGLCAECKKNNPKKSKEVDHVHRS
jgi:Fur family peroxide stress response transcriptional regulator